MNVHFIAIGGAAMHNLAIALHKKGYLVSGSDDEIFDPAKTRLEQYGLLPERFGWYPEKLHQGIDAIILGMHARADNPELLKASELGLRIYSYPGYLYEQSKGKTRVVIGGSHGKTTITAMILHVLKHAGIDSDFMVGAQLEGFDVMVRLTENARFMVFEGDEYLTSALDRRPKFHLYQPDIALISGIAWDHVNVFPTFEIYSEQFSIFASMIPAGGKLIYCAEDKVVERIASGVDSGVELFPYRKPEYTVRDGVTVLKYGNGELPLKIFGHHNMLNMEGARLVCEAMGVSRTVFFEAIKSFTGASRRLELIGHSQSSAVFKDFAHSPSKLKATVQAVKEQFPERKLIACMELHTFSSLSAGFLEEYKDSMEMADVAIVYYSRHALQLKKLPDLVPEDISSAFNKSDIQVYNESDELRKYLYSLTGREANLLMMSSGNFDGINLSELAVHFISEET